MIDGMLNILHQCLKYGARILKGVNTPKETLFQVLTKESFSQIEKCCSICTLYIKVPQNAPEAIIRV